MSPNADDVPGNDGESSASKAIDQAQRPGLGLAILLVLLGISFGTGIGGYLTWRVWGTPLIERSDSLAERLEELSEAIHEIKDAARTQAEKVILQAEELQKMEFEIENEIKISQKIGQELATITQERDRLLERLLSPPVPEEPPLPLEVFQNTIGVQLRLLPAGTFLMGDERDGPVHEVKLSTQFYLGVMEVTWEQWQQVMKPPDPFGKAGHPVSGISWNQALHFCERLSAIPAEHQAGRTYRLPTEAEWEYACRAGTRSRYGFGNNPNELIAFCWFADNAVEAPHPAGQLLPNPWGFHDMHGNVGEWCQDWFAPYADGRAVQDPRGPNAGHRGIWRGGCHLSPASDCTAARRGRLEPTDACDGIGIRLAMDLPKPDGLLPPVEWKFEENDEMLWPSVDIIHNSTGMEYRQVPGGEFTMGDHNEFQADANLHPVTITKPFFLGVYEVSNEQWERVMGVPGPGKQPLPDLPVAGVTWMEANEFCTKLSEQPFEKAIGRRYRLPTEAEWEYACRAGTDTRFAFGNNPQQLQAHGWYQLNTEGDRRPVGHKKPNGWGFYDMHGNVYEWCQDLWAPQPKVRKIDPRGPPTGSLRVLRGGSWAEDASHCESAHREQRKPNDPLDSILGFRVAMELGTPTRHREKQLKRRSPDASE